MYARSISIEDFKCFSKAELQFQYPGRDSGAVSELDNVNLILGDNGGGKSSVLRAVAIAMLAPTLPNVGFVANRLVRRVRSGMPTVDLAVLSLDAWRPSGEVIPGAGRRQAYRMSARIRLSNSGPDRLLPANAEENPWIARVLELEDSSALFIVGYGASRFVESGDFVPSSARKSRGLRFQRVAGLFEDNVKLRPMQSWLPSLQAKSKSGYASAIALINKVLPDNIRFSGEQDEREGQYIFEFSGLRTPFGALSDGYKAYVGWVSDLVGHLADVAGPKQALGDIGGIVMVDEIDLHLHPEWQRTVVPTLAKAFPKLQFILTTHSPIIAATVKKENVFVTDTASDGTAMVKQLQEHVFGRSAEQLLLSSYFGLQTTRPEAFQDQAEQLFKRAANGDTSAALAYLDRLVDPSSGNEGGARKAAPVKK